MSVRKVLAIFLLPLAVAVLLFVLIPMQARVVEHIAIEQTPQDAGLAYEEFSLQPFDRPLRLAGWWMPAENARASLVFIHGGGSSRHSSFFNSVPFYAALVQRGINVTAIDLRNHGASEDDPHGMQFGLAEKYDAMAAVAWTAEKRPALPVFLMGISMGGASSIYASAEGAEVSGLILLDSMLDAADTFARGGRAQTGLPHWLYLPSAWSAQQFFGYPSGEEEALAVAASLRFPILVMVDPDDPVTRAVYSEELVRRNDNATLWRAPPVPEDHPDLARRQDWGTHVMAFAAHPQETVDRVIEFIDTVLADQSPRYSGLPGAR